MQLLDNILVVYLAQLHYLFALPRQSSREGEMGTNYSGSAILANGFKHTCHVACRSRLPELAEVRVRAVTEPEMLSRAKK